MSLLAVPLALLLGCGDDEEERYCETWCEMALSVELEQLDTDGCELTDAVEELEAGCVEQCDEIGAKVESRSDVKVCVVCVHGEVGGSPTWDELQGALNGPCEPKCFTVSMSKFWEDFWDDWGYEDYDYDCES